VRTQERDPRRLLRPLTATLAARGAPLPLALFVPADSSYAKLAPAAGPPDLSWQASLQAVWEAEFAGAPRAPVSPRPVLSRQFAAAPVHAADEGTPGPLSRARGRGGGGPCTMWRGLVVGPRYAPVTACTSA